MITDWEILHVTLSLALKIFEQRNVYAESCFTFDLITVISSTRSKQFNGSDYFRF